LAWELAVEERGVGLRDEDGLGLEGAAQSLEHK
jgi:hypothetical protein